jgi:hypothetical protein
MSLQERIMVQMQFYGIILAEEDVCLVSEELER